MLPKKLPFEQVAEVFRKEGYTLLNYHNRRTKVDYICPAGHKHFVFIDNFLYRNIRCPYCLGRARHTYKEVKQLFEDKGFDLVSKTYLNNKADLHCICPNGHTVSITLCSFLKGNGCRQCSIESSRNNFEKVKKDFADVGYLLLSQEYRNAHQKLDYICSAGHLNTTKYNKFQSGRRCSLCAITAKPTLEKVKEMFSNVGYTLLSENYINSRAKLEFICDRGHQGAISYGSFLNQKARCLACRIENQRGSKSHFWNPDLTDEERLDQRKYPEYSQWRKMIFARDGYKCVGCGYSKGKILVAHHLDSYRDNPESRTALDNGVTLCKECHKKFHSQYGWGNNNRVQFQWFMLQTFGRTIET